MLSYALKKILMLIPTLFFVTITVFVVMRLVPGDPVVLMLGDMADPDLVERTRAELGLNKPLLVQYTDWIGQLLHLDFGKSVVTGEEVLPAMLERFGVTAQVVTISVIFAAVIAVLFGTLAAWRQNRLTDTAIVTFAAFSMSVPSFWLAIALVLLFGVELQWLPTFGYISPFVDFKEGILFLILPVTALVVAETGGILRMVRSTTIDVLRLDYITHARAKGISEGAVLFRHALKNTFIPTLTLIGLVLGSLLGGAAVVETVFTLPGLGRLLVTSIYARDYVMVQGVMILVSSAYVFVNSLIDLMYPLFDPRVKL
ncbi:MAG: ABC transporter permease [Kordiimonadaceae bacterium]|nr:ABC transporter permease [Kordiimonadaceae bacterium]